VPPPAIRDLREMVRHRRTLIETRTAVRNRVLKLLEGANIKLSGVASDVFGVSGMAMLEALAAGTNNAAEMAGLARGRMRRKHMTFFRKTPGNQRLLAGLPPGRFVESDTGVLVDDKAYFETFDMEEEGR
jgi:transposase